jgi:hypothetical protein
MSIRNLNLLPTPEVCPLAVSQSLMGSDEWSNKEPPELLGGEQVLMDSNEQSSAEHSANYSGSPPDFAA